MSKQQRRRAQTPKPRNEEWMRARLDQSNRNNTVPSGKRYKLDDAIQNGVRPGKDIAYMSIGGYLIFVPADESKKVRRFRLEEI
jgi:hypothetical protein